VARGGAAAGRFAPGRWASVHRLSVRLMTIGPSRIFPPIYSHPLPRSSGGKHVPAIRVRYLLVFGIRCRTFSHADVAGTTLVHFPLVFDCSDHQVGRAARIGFLPRSMHWTPIAVA
jgi:hypothetical protein